MARLPVAVQTISRSGVTPTLAAPQASGAGGNYFINNGRCFLMLVADGTAADSTNITINTPLSVDSQAVADRVVALPKSTMKLIGPFPVGDQTYDQGGNVIWFDCSAVVTGITCAVISI